MSITNYEIKHILGNGKFGYVYKGIHVQTKKAAAIKISSICDNWSIEHEAKCYMMLKGIDGIPKMKYFGCLHNHCYIVMDLMGEALTNIKNQYHKSRDAMHFSQETIGELGIKLLQILQSIHKRGIVHRDIKPANILIDISNKHNSVNIADFGLASLYITNKNKHISYRSGTSGSLRYMSLNSHKNVYSVRRDDIESMCYVLWELMEGKLPWMGAEDSSKVERIKKIKWPQNIALHLFLTHARKLKYDETPNYSLLRGYLKRLCR